MGRRGGKHFPRWDPVRLYPRAFANVKASLFQTSALTSTWLEVGVRDAKPPAKKMGPRHQLATEKQIKMELVICRY